MNKTLNLYGYLLVIVLFSFGCSNNNSTTNEEAMVSTKSVTIATKQEVVEQQPIKQAIENSTRKQTDINEIFKDSVDLLPNGKYMIMLFDSENCSYCIKLKKDILADEKLKNRIKNNFSAYQLSLDENRVYNFLYHEKIVKADTNLLKNIYSITSTPTLLFDDKNAKNIFIISGYISPEQFSATLDFIEEGIWKGKDRKSGEIYKALEEYYAKKGLVEKGKIETH